MSRKYTLAHEIKIESPNAKIPVMRTTGIDQSNAHPNGNPIAVRMTKNTKIVGRKFMKDMYVTEMGSMIRGKAVLRMSF